MIGIVTALTASSIAAGAVVAGTTLAAVPERDTDRSVPCGAVWQRLPGELRDDLSALEGMTPAERRVALQEIRRDARQGEYGDRVQRVARRMAERRAGLTPEQRREVREAITERLRERRKDCA